MECKKMKKIYSLLAISALASVGLLGMTPAAKADYYSPQKLTMREETKIVYSCQPQDNQFVTVPQIVQEREWKYAGMVNTLVDEQVVQQYSPVIIWTESLGSKAYPYTPESRCKAVSARLTNLAASLGVNTPDKIALLGQSSLNGVVNHERVIYSHYENQPASRKNVIFTLKPGNRPMYSNILTKFRVGTAGSVGGASLSPSELPPIVE
jgi:hypothetical protein